MSKEMVICIVIIVAIVILNVITQNYTKESIETVKQELGTFKDNIMQVREEQENQQESKKQNEERLNKQIEEVIKNWREKYNNLAYYIEHDELEKVETELKSLKANIEVAEYEQSIPDIEKSIFILEHIKEKFRFSIQNIF